MEGASDAFGQIDDGCDDLSGPGICIENALSASDPNAMNAAATRVERPPAKPEINRPSIESLEAPCKARALRIYDLVC